MEQYRSNFRPIINILLYQTFENIKLEIFFNKKNGGGAGLFGESARQVARRPT